jgi:hypothetical protein
MLGRIFLMVVVTVLVMVVVGVLVAVDRDERKAGDDVFIAEIWPMRSIRTQNNFTPLTSRLANMQTNVIFTHKETRLRKLDHH